MRLLTTVAILLLIVPVAFAGDEPVRFDLTADDIRAPVEDWYGIYVGGAKSGHARMTITREDSTFVVEMTLLLRFKAMGEVSEIGMTDRRVFAGTAPFQFLKGFAETRQAGETLKTEVENGEDGLAVVITGSAGVRRMARPAIDYTLSDHVFTTQLWLRRGPKVGDSLSFRSYDLDDLKMDVDTLKVREVSDSLLLGVETTFYTLDASSRDSGATGIQRADGSGRMLSLTVGDMIEIRMEPEALATQSGYGGDLFWNGAVKIDEPIGDARQVRSLVLEVKGEGATTLESGPQQQVEPGDPTLIRLGHGVPAVKATPEEIEEALAVEVEYPIEDEVVVALAREAIGDAKAPREKVRRLVHFVSEYVDDQLGCDSGQVRTVIQNKKGDCTEHALLFTCLARAVGIPTREVGGLMYMGDRLRSFGPHAWNEVVLDGVWVPVDATWDELPADGARVQFGDDDQNGLVLLSTMGRLSFTVKEVVRGE